MSPHPWNDYTGKPSGGEGRLRVHLRTGAGTAFPGAACGNDARTTQRTGARGSAAVPLTDDPKLVTCQQCRRSLPYQRLTGG